MCIDGVGNWNLLGGGLGCRSRIFNNPKKKGTQNFVYFVVVFNILFYLNLFYFIK